MAQSSTLSIGVEVHKDSIAVADIAKDHDAKVASLGPSAPATVTSIPSSATDHPRQNIPSSSRKPGHVALGSIAI
jgi:hypothetical protein